jgi:hypothetical protein
MAYSLLTLGTFSFEGLESPERIHLKTKQRLVVHHLGSGATTVDYLGDDYETVSFGGIFSGAYAADRIRSIDFLRVSGAPVILAWSAKTLSVIIRQFELDYSSDRWIPYKLSCYVIRSLNARTASLSDVMSLSAATQVNDMFGLLTSSDITPTSDQIAALLTLGGLNFDTPPSDALGQAQSLADAMADELEALAQSAQTDVPVDQQSPLDTAPSIAALVASFGQQSALILGRNRVMNIIASAEDVAQH